MTISLVKKYKTACFEGNVALVKYMIENEDKIIKCPELLIKYFEEACKGGHDDVFETLNEYKNITTCGLYAFYSVLKHACQGGNTILIKKLLGIYDDNYRTKRSDGKHMINECIYGASLGGQLEIFKTFLLNFDVNLYFNPDLLYSCLKNACKAKNVDLVNFIVETINSAPYSLSEEQIIMNWDWCLGNACESGCIEIVDICIEHRATNWSGGLVGACSGGYIEIAKLMISKGARNFDFSMWFAGSHGHMDIVKLLIDNGSEHYNICMASACSGGHIKIIELMISKGANNWDFCVNKMRSNNIDNYYEILDILIAHGANDREAFLQYACYHGNMHIARTSINMGATDFYAGLSEACKNGQIQLAKIMLDKISPTFDIDKLNHFVHDTVLSAKKHGTGSYIIHMLISAGVTDLKYIDNTTDFQVYCRYCKHKNMEPDYVRYSELLENFSPYILFVGSQVKNIRDRRDRSSGNCSEKTTGMNHTKRLPIEIFRLMFMY